MNGAFSRFQPHQFARRGQRKLKFTSEDDKRLAKYVAMVGDNDWSKIASLMGDRNGRQCRERWNNYVNPNLRTDPWTQEEIQLLFKKYQELGPKWNRIAKFFRNRSTNSIKNKWMSLRRKEQSMYFEFRKQEHPPNLGQQFNSPQRVEGVQNNVAQQQNIQNIVHQPKNDDKHKEHIIFPSLMTMIPDKDKFFSVLLPNNQNEKRT